MDYRKIKSAPKRVTPRSQLRDTILATMRLASEVVGATLGPGGCPVLIERFEHDLPPVVTKDGVTVMRSLGLEDSTAQCILEAARDAAIRTANEAGDGTTTATVLAEAVVRLSEQFCTDNPQVPPARVARTLESTFRDRIEPFLRDKAMKADEDQLLLHVATVSANGERELAEKVLECFQVGGDDGNVTIIEQLGPSGYLAEPLDGYPIPAGWEESCRIFAAEFVGAGGQQLRVDNPLFLLYYGAVDNPAILASITNRLHSARLAYEQQEEGAVPVRSRNLVVIATAFSDVALAGMAATTRDEELPNMIPVRLPQLPMANGQYEVLRDLAAFTGAVVFDPVHEPVESAQVVDLGPGMEAFEMARWRCNIIGRPESEEHERAVMARADELGRQVGAAASEAERRFLNERRGKLLGGITRLTVIGPTPGETKEKRDRAEDAVCAVRGAIQHGVLPGGGRALLELSKEFEGSQDSVLSQILAPALREPTTRILRNAGLNDQEVQEVLRVLDQESDFWETYDASQHRFVDALETGLMDSAQAVIESVRNSLSIASLLGTLGGTVVFARDHALESREASDVQDWRRAAGINEANERP